MLLQVFEVDPLLRTIAVLVDVDLEASAALADGDDEDLLRLHVLHHELYDVVLVADYGVILTSTQCT